MWVAIHILACLVSSVVMSNSLVLVTYATDPQHENLGLLRDTARWHGWRAPHVIGTQEGFTTHGLVDKLRALRRFSKDWPDDTILAFVDGYDVVVNNEPSALEAAFLASGKRVLVASELGCCSSKATALAGKLDCHTNWPFHEERRWLNTGVIVGYAPDIRRLLKLAWREYKTNATMYQMYTDQLVICVLMSEGSTIWTRAAVAIDHRSEMALTTYKTDITMGQVLGLDELGRIVFSNQTIPAFIHFNGPKEEKKAQMAYAKANFPLLIKARLTSNTYVADVHLKRHPAR